jgi:broad specificity phosphatase PhoE
MDVRAYLQRHGSTALSPFPEGWLPIPLNAKGRDDALAGAAYLKQHISENNLPTPDYIVTSDLTRTEQTADIAAKTLGIKIVTTLPGLRAFEGEEETPEEYEARSEEALKQILAEDQLPLVVAHRSTTGFLDKKFGADHSDDGDWQPDYKTHSLLREGGVLALANPKWKLLPIYQPILENWPPEHQD